MDTTTYSDSKAAQRLTELLQEPQFSSVAKAARVIVSKWFLYSSALMDIKDNTVRRGSLQMWRNHFLSWVKGRNLPPAIETHLSNVIVTQYRKCCTRSRKRDMASKSEVL